MPVFALMTRLSADAFTTAEGRRTLGKEWMSKVKNACPDVKWIAHYAILGPYDFMDIYEAPDVETAHRISVISRSEGAVTAESWQLLAYDRYLEIMEDVQAK